MALNPQSQYFDGVATVKQGEVQEQGYEEEENGCKSGTNVFQGICNSYGYYKQTPWPLVRERTIPTDPTDISIDELCVHLHGAQSLLRN
jgi:hypothetical protein